LKSSKLLVIHHFQFEVINSETTGVILDDDDSLKLSRVIVEDESSDLGELELASDHFSSALVFKSSKEGEVKTDDLTSAALPLSIEGVISEVEAIC
jgi:hypothetical protein